MALRDHRNRPRLTLAAVLFIVSLLIVLAWMLMWNRQWPGLARGLDKGTDKLLAASLALAAYISTTAMRMKERRGDYRREVAKELAETDETKRKDEYIRYLRQKMRDRTCDVVVLLAPDIYLTVVTIMLGVRLAVWGLPEGATARAAGELPPPAFDGAILGLLTASALTLACYHFGQWITAIPGDEVGEPQGEEVPQPQIPAGNTQGGANGARAELKR